MFLTYGGGLEESGSFQNVSSFLENLTPCNSPVESFYRNSETSGSFRKFTVFFSRNPPPKKIEIRDLPLLAEPIVPERKPLLPWEGVERGHHPPQKVARSQEGCKGWWNGSEGFGGPTDRRDLRDEREGREGRDEGH